MAVVPTCITPGFQASCCLIIQSCKQNRDVKNIKLGQDRHHVTSASCSAGWCKSHPVQSGKLDFNRQYQHQSQVRHHLSGLLTSVTQAVDWPISAASCWIKCCSVARVYNIDNGWAPVSMPFLPWHFLKASR
eukprot:scaffold86075_cov19-Prasinocladus_malaysianus.AAC.2